MDMIKRRRRTNKIPGEGDVAGIKGAAPILYLKAARSSTCAKELRNRVREED